MRKELAYVSGPYSADTKEEKIANIDRARKIAAELWDRGYAVICPHSNTAFFGSLCKVAGYDDFLLGDLTMIDYVDLIVITPDWFLSKGAKIEIEYAFGQGIPIYVYPEMPEDLGCAQNKNV